MTTRLIIWISAFENTQGHWLLDMPDKGCEHKESEQKQGLISAPENLLSLAGLSAEHETLLLVPGEHIRMASAHLPSNSKDALKSLPYQLEATLGQDIDTLDFFPLKKQLLPDKRLPVLICAKQFIQDCRQWLEDSGIQADAVLPDYMALPQVSGADDGNSFSWNGRLLYRAESAAGVIPSEHIEQNAPLGALAPVLNFSSVECDASLTPLQQLVRHLPVRISFSLLRIKRKKKLAQSDGARKRWMIAAALALVLTNVGLQGVQIWHLQDERQRLNTAIDQLFRQTLPGVRKVNPVVQIRQVVQKQQQAEKINALFQALAAVSASKRGSGVILDSLTYDAASGDIQFEITEGAQIDQNKLQQGLQAQGMQLTVQSNQYTAREIP